MLANFVIVFSILANATRDCLSGGVWAAKTNYSYCTTKEDPIDPPDLEISIIVYFVGKDLDRLAGFESRPWASPMQMNNADAGAKWSGISIF